MGVTGEPVLTEVQAGVTIRWFCVPPPRDTWFRVTRQEWSADWSQRDIYAWQRSRDHYPRRPDGVLTDCGDFVIRVVPSWG